MLRHAGVVLTDFNSIARHLRACNYSADYNLPPKQVEKVFGAVDHEGVLNSQVAEASAFIQLMDEKLAPALRSRLDKLKLVVHLNLPGISFGLIRRTRWR